MTEPARPTWHASVDDLVARVEDGARVGVCGFHFTRLPIVQLRSLRRRRGLTYVAWGGGLALEILLEAGSVAAAEVTFSSLDLYGPAPRFRRAVESGELKLTEWTALGMIKGFQARSQRLGFEVMQPLTGTELGTGWARDLVDPYAPADTWPVGAAPALPMDVFLLHASRADDAGNVEILGARGLDLSAALAADRVLVTVEERVPRLAARPNAFVLPRTFVAGLAVARGGAYPTSCLPDYPADHRALARIAATGPDAPIPAECLAPTDRRAAELREIAATPVAPLRAALRRPDPGPTTPADRHEVLVCALARTLGNASVATVGSASPLPTVAYLLAKTLWAPQLLLMSFNGGLVDIAWRPACVSLAEQLDFHTAVAHTGGDETYHWYYQQGRVTHEVVGAAQLDQHGATNNVVIRRSDGGSVRLPGQGGMADVANLHREFVLYLPRHSPRNTVPRVDFASAVRTVPGRTTVYTDLGIFRRDGPDELLTLTHLHPGVELSEVEDRTGWPLHVAPDLAVTDPPTDTELRVLRQDVDPLGVSRLDVVRAAERGALIAELLTAEEAALAQCRTVPTRQTESEQ